MLCTMYINFFTENVGYSIEYPWIHGRLVVPEGKDKNEKIKVKMTRKYGSQNQTPLY